MGLAEQSPHNPLKVLHARLEPRRLEDAVSVIAISNWELDRSKLSRALVLACPPPSHADLRETALAIIRAYLDHETHIRNQLMASLEPMAKAFMEILKIKGLQTSMVSVTGMVYALLLHVCCWRQMCRWV